MAKKEWDFEPFDIMGQDDEPKQSRDVFDLKKPLLEEDDDKNFDEPLLDMSNHAFQTVALEESEEDEESFQVFDIMNGEVQEEEIKEAKKTPAPKSEEIPFDVMSNAKTPYAREEEFEEEEEDDDSPLDVISDDEKKKEAFFKAVIEEKEMPMQKNIKEIPAIEKDDEIAVLKSAFSTSKSEDSGEIFKDPQKQPSPSFERYDTSDFTPRLTPLAPSRNSTSAKIIKGIAVAVVCIMTLVIVWLEGGRAYIENSNEKFYDKVCAGENLELINPNFAFFLTIEEADVRVPVINSTTTCEFKSFDGKLLYPGTVVTAQNGSHTIITGAPALLGSIADTKAEEIILQSGQETLRYEVFTAHKCDELLRDVDPFSETLTVYVKLSSGNGEVYALHAKKAQ